ncbi:hypothetical protein RJ640_021938 [Escallonia rubra]|uniref:FAD-binding domain-containing protein n=1 Tax=Escallonia rubra TaxID=112253 RepID=A0AA88RLY5_9ASTE|nr:hypothetical protein RJ640_021938 [Escallonia rubra]
MAAQSQPHPLHSLTRTIKASPASLKLLRKLSRLIVAAKSNPRPNLSGRKLRVAVIGGGPAGSSVAKSLARGGVETLLLERSPAFAKPCGGAIPLCMLNEFNIPSHLVDSKATHMKIIFSSNLTVDQPPSIEHGTHVYRFRRMGQDRGTDETILWDLQAGGDSDEGNPGDCQTTSKDAAYPIA